MTPEAPQAEAVRVPGRVEVVEETPARQLAARKQLVAPKVVAATRRVEARVWVATARILNARATVRTLSSFTARIGTTPSTVGAIPRRRSQRTIARNASPAETMRRRPLASVWRLLDRFADLQPV